MATITLTPATSASNGNIPFIGDEANDNKGTTIRESFSRINARLTEIYGAQNSGTPQTPFVDTDNIKDANVTLAKIQDVAANTVLVRDANSTGVLSPKAVTDTQILIGDGTGFTAAALSSDVTMTNAGAVTIANDAVTTAKIADDAITTALIADDAVTSALIADNAITNALMADDAIDHGELAPRYTEIQDISTTSGTINLVASTFTAFNMTGNMGTATLELQNMKTGQVVDIIFTGSDLSSAAITLSDNFTTSKFNKVGTTSFDTSSKNILQVLCVDDTGGDAILAFAISKVTESSNTATA